MHQSSETLALERLDVLVGKWTMEAGPAGGPPFPGEAAVTFEWLTERTFLIERWVVPEAFDGIAIIGAGEQPDSFRRHYFDARGEHRIYEMTLDEGVWKQWRDAPDPFPQRFSATFADDGQTISGRWEKARDGVTWEDDINVVYRKLP
jgi:hypothetical protein